MLQWRLFRRVLTTTMAVVVMMVAVIATPAQAAVYADKLCSEGDFRVNIAPVKSWSIARVHATSDYTANSNGYSFRTCSWTGTNHLYRYRCTSATAGTWKLSLVAREENGNGVRTQIDVRCDGYERSIYWGHAHNAHWPVHFHLWAPRGTGCADSGCEQYAYNWYAVVQ